LVAQEVAVKMSTQARIVHFRVYGEPGSEREAARQVVEAVQWLALPAAQIERIKTAVSEAVMNAVEHGNDNRSDLAVHLLVEMGSDSVTISVFDHGMMRTLPELPIEPDLAAKLAGEQRPRGWGMFLIRSMVDELSIRNEPSRHCIEMTFAL
jgi:anti-sigma regulatory factor (Ser/Thr protein kinase)